MNDIGIFGALLIIAANAVFFIAGLMFGVNITHAWYAQNKDAHK